MDNTPLAMAQRIETAINHLTKLCSEIDDCGNKKAETLLDYECAFSVAILKRRDGGEPATLIRDNAKKDRREERLKSELAEIKYKSLTTKIDAAKAILNARQSQNRYLSEL